MSPVLLPLPSGPTSFTTLVLDFTGTLSEGGRLLPGVDERLGRLVAKLRIVVLTADTFGTARDISVLQDGSDTYIAVATPDEDIVITEAFQAV